MSTLELAARLNLEGGDYVSTTRRAKEETKNLKDEIKETGRASRSSAKGMDSAAKETKELTNEQKKLQKESKSTTQSLMSIKNVITGIAFGLAATDFSRTVIEYEKFKGQLETTFRGAEDLSERAFKAIETFASETPFTLDQSLNAFVKLRNMGIAPTRDLMLSMANTAAASGKDLNQFVEAVADAATGEFERLKEFGVKARSEGDQVAFTFQGVTTQVGKNQAEIVEYLQAIGETQFADAAAKQMEKLPGQLSNLRDNVQSLWRTLGDAGATQVMADGIAFVSEGISDLTNLISSGALSTYIEAEFGAWIDAAQWVGDKVQWLWGLVDDFYGVFYEFYSGNELQPDQSGIAKLLGWWAEQFAIMPQNANLAFEMVVGAATKLKLGLKERFELMFLSAEQTWLEMQRSGEKLFDILELYAARAVDAIVGYWADMIGRMASGLENLPDRLVPDSWIQGLRNTEASMRSVATREEAMRAEIEANTAAYESQLAALEDRRQSTQAFYDEQRAEVDASIRAANQERDAAIRNRDALHKKAAAQIEAGKAASVSKAEHDELAKAMMAVGDNAEQSGEQAEAASDKTIKAAQRQLEGVERAVESERERVERWYRDSVSQLEEAERLKLSSTKSYADLRADVEAEYTERLEKLDKDSNEKRLKSTRKFGGDLSNIYDDFGDVWTNLFQRNEDAAKDSFDSILDSAISLFTKIALQWAAKGLDKLFNLGGEGGGFTFSGALEAFGGGGNVSFGGSSNTGGINPLALTSTSAGQAQTAQIADALGIDPSTLQNVAQGANGLQNIYVGVQRGDASGYLQAASGAVDTYNTYQRLTGGTELSNNFTNGLSAAGNVLGIYNGLRQGGVEGYGTAALNGYQLYNTASGFFGSTGGLSAAQSQALASQYSQFYSTAANTGLEVGTTAVNSATAANTTTAATTANTASSNLGLTNYAGAVAGAYNIYSGVERGNSAGYTQAAGGAITAASSLGYLSFLGPYGAAIGAVISLLAAGRGSRPYEQILAEDYMPELFGVQNSIEAIGADGGRGFAGGNQAVFGNNLGFDRIGLSAQLLNDGGRNGNGGFFTGAQSSLDAFEEALRSAGFDELLDNTGGILRVFDKDKNIEDIEAVLAALDEGVETAVTNSEKLETALRNNLIQPQNHFYEQFGVGMAQNADQARESILRIQNDYLALRENGTEEIEALTKAFSDHYKISEDETRAFFEFSGFQMEGWTRQFELSTQDQLRDILDFNEAGQTAFQQLAEAAHGSATSVQNIFDLSLSQIGARFGELGSDARRAFEAARAAAGEAGFDGARAQRNGRPIPSLKVGTPRLESDGLVYAHKDEMILDPQAANYLRQYGIPVQQPRATESDARIVELGDRLERLAASMDRQAAEQSNTNRELRKLTRRQKEAA